MGEFQRSHLGKNAGANVDGVHVKCVVRALLVGLCTHLLQPSGLASDTLL
jgi:hypothetical protein